MAEPKMTRQDVIDQSEILTTAHHPSWDEECDISYLYLLDEDRFVFFAVRQGDKSACHAVHPDDYEMFGIGVDDDTGMPFYTDWDATTEELYGHPVTGFEAKDGQRFVVTKWVEGQEVRFFVRREGWPETSEQISIARLAEMDLAQDAMKGGLHGLT